MPTTIPNGPAQAPGSRLELDPRLQRDTHAVATLPSGALRLMDDARWFWAIIVPNHEGATELHDLTVAERNGLMADAAQLSKAIAAITQCRSVNIAMLGNVVRQLHCHVVARDETDPAWPGPVWGHGAREPMERGEVAKRIKALQLELGSDHHHGGHVPHDSAAGRKEPT